MNENIFLFLNSFSQQNQYFDWLVYFCAVLLPWALILSLLFFIVMAEDKRRALLHVFIFLGSALAAWFLTSLVKYNFPTSRPFEILDINPLFWVERGEAMPSGHATFAGALAMAVFLLKKKLSIIFIIGALLIGLARIIAGVHWPVDIVAGYLVGALVSVLIYFIYMKISRAFSLRHIDSSNLP